MAHVLAIKQIWTGEKTVNVQFMDKPFHSASETFYCHVYEQHC
jgi:hypothetical protein